MKKNEIVAQICLYGSSACGHGYLAHTKAEPGKFHGTGEPRQHRSATEAVWLAIDDLKAAGVRGGLVRIFASGGKMMADCEINAVGYFGDLKWVPATVLVISAEEIEKHAVVA